VFTGTPAETQPVPRRDLRAHVSVLEARSKLEAHVQATLPFPEKKSHHVLVRDRQPTAQRFTNIIIEIIIIVVINFVCFYFSNLSYMYNRYELCTFSCRKRK
jgi:hypothetical protein